jgi:hypothetical protein
MSIIKANHLGLHEYESVNIENNKTYNECLQQDKSGKFILYVETERTDLYNNVLVDTDTMDIVDVYWYGKKQLKPIPYQTKGEKDLEILLRRFNGEVYKLDGIINE